MSTTGLCSTLLTAAMVRRGSAAALMCIVKKNGSLLNMFKSWALLAEFTTQSLPLGGSRD